MGGADFREDAGKFFGIIVWEDAKRGVGGAGCIDEAGVGEAIKDNKITFPYNDRNGGEGGGVAGGESESRLGVFCSSNGFL